jgi:pimeloyl-ACP methyl ester carboxylesterase
VSIVAKDVPVTAEQASTPSESHELVVLIHGFAAPAWVMFLLANRLRAAGYQTHLWSYLTFRDRLRDHSDRLAEELDKLASDSQVSKLHIVAHSMGTIVARGALRKLKPNKLSRVVLMAPPNRGVNWARWFGPILKYLIPTVYDLSSDASSYVNNLPSPDHWYVGIVRADFDFLIPRHSVELSEQMDFISYPSFHSGLLFRRDVAEAVREFLKTGSFPMPSRRKASV